MINIVVTSKPVDGLLYYSYEYCDILNKAGVPAQVVIISHRKFNQQEYIDVLKTKYTTYEKVLIDTYLPSENDVTLIMGRSMMTLSWQNFNNYTNHQQRCLRKLFSSNVISVYSENHPVDYQKSVKFYSPRHIVNLCDTAVYPNGIGEHFEKHINFDIYKPYVDDQKFRYLFLGTNDKYYAAAESVLHKYPDHGILTYQASYVNLKNRNIFVPISNLMGLFDTYVYTKATFDPAPRIIQECKYFDKNIIYERDNKIVDGGSVYWRRDFKKPDILPILNALGELNEN